MKARLIPVLFAACLPCFGNGAARAGQGMEPRSIYLTPEERGRMRDQIRQQWEQMSPEERQKQRESWRDRWQNMPPEERMRRREEMRERWERLSPEQRERLREAIREHRSRDGGPPPGFDRGPRR